MTAPETRMLPEFLDWHRDTFLMKCQGLTAGQLAERPLKTTMSLLGLIRHMSKVERTWLRQRFAGQDVEPLFGHVRDADFDEAATATAREDYERLLTERRLADAAVRGAALDDTFTHNGDDYSLRLVYVHLIGEYARHNGHADLLREYVDGATGA